jgi:hypothetical protein
MRVPSPRPVDKSGEALKSASLIFIPWVERLLYELEPADARRLAKLLNETANFSCVYDSYGQWSVARRSTPTSRR